MGPTIFDIIKELIVAWREGTRKTRFFIAISGSLLALGAIVVFISKLMMNLWVSRIGENIGVAIMVTGGLGAILVSFVQRSKEEVKKEKKIEEVERRVQENPKESKAAWELARVKLESYLDRNLSQGRSIYWLTLLVMIAGFILIGVGVYEAFQSASNLNPAILTTGSGVIVSFIGGTFLVLYKATMAQSKDYVSILERINAVGMSVQILETLENDETKLRQETTAKVAKQLLTMYSKGDSKNNRIKRSKKNRTADV